jgi:hypothetical protein
MQVVVAVVVVCVCVCVCVYIPAPTHGSTHQTTVLAPALWALAAFWATREKESQASSGRRPLFRPVVCVCVCVYVCEWVCVRGKRGREGEGVGATYFL